MKMPRKTARRRRRRLKLGRASRAKARRPFVAADAASINGSLSLHPTYNAIVGATVDAPPPYWRAPPHEHKDLFGTPRFIRRPRRTHEARLQGRPRPLRRRQHSLANTRRLCYVCSLSELTPWSFRKPGEEVQPANHSVRTLYNIRLRSRSTPAIGCRKTLTRFDSALGKRVAVPESEPESRPVGNPRQARVQTSILRFRPDSAQTLENTAFTYERWLEILPETLNFLPHRLEGFGSGGLSV
jgi:hypothetical protein